MSQLIMTTLEHLECAHCNMSFGVTAQFMDARREDHATFYCPNKHAQSYHQDNELEKTKKFLRNAQSRTIAAEEHAEQCCQIEQAAVRSARAYKGHLTRAKNA